MTGFTTNYEQRLLHYALDHLGEKIEWTDQDLRGPNGNPYCTWSLCSSRLGDKVQVEIYAKTQNPTLLTLVFRERCQVFPSQTLDQPETLGPPEIDHEVRQIPANSEMMYLFATRIAMQEATSATPQSMPLTSPAGPALPTPAPSCSEHPQQIAPGPAPSGSIAQPSAAQPTCSQSPVSPSGQAQPKAPPPTPMRAFDQLIPLTSGSVAPTRGVPSSGQALPVVPPPVAPGPVVAAPVGMTQIPITTGSALSAPAQPIVQSSVPLNQWNLQKPVIQLPTSQPSQLPSFPKTQEEQQFINACQKPYPCGQRDNGPVLCLMDSWNMAQNGVTEQTIQEAFRFLLAKKAHWRDFAPLVLFAQMHNLSMELPLSECLAILQLIWKDFDFYRPMPPIDLSCFPQQSIHPLELLVRYVGSVLAQAPSIEPTGSWWEKLGSPNRQVIELAASLIEAVLSKGILPNDMIKKMMSELAASLQIQSSYSSPSLLDPFRARKLIINASAVLDSVCRFNCEKAFRALIQYKR